MRILDYKMYTYVVSYVYRAHVRDDLGETTGRMMTITTTLTEKVVACSRAMADAWIRERHNASYLNHKDFEFRLIEEQSAPHLLIEYAA